MMLATAITNRAYRCMFYGESIVEGACSEQYSTMFWPMWKLLDARTIAENIKRIAEPRTLLGGKISQWFHSYFVHEIIEDIDCFEILLFMPDFQYLKLMPPIFYYRFVGTAIECTTIANTLEELGVPFAETVENAYLSNSIPYYYAQRDCFVSGMDKTATAQDVADSLYAAGAVRSAKFVETSPHRLLEVYA